MRVNGVCRHVLTSAAGGGTKSAQEKRPDLITFRTGDERRQRAALPFVRKRLTASSYLAVEAYVPRRQENAHVECNSCGMTLLAARNNL